MKKFSLIIGISVVLFFSCDDGGSSGGGGGGGKSSPAPEKTFKALNYANNTYYDVKASLLAQGSYSEIWVENGSRVNRAAAKKIADEYDKIYAMMINYFSKKDITNPFYSSSDPSSGRPTYPDIMRFALALTGESKVCILLLDIKDNYQKDVNDSYIAGLFDPINIFSKGDYPNSNESVMLYIDTNPLEPAESEMYKTIAHEMQHLMNFVSSIIYRLNSNTVYSMDTWIDEGLSAAAEWLYSGKHSDDRWIWYNRNGDGKNMKGMIDAGNNFFVWGNRGESQYAVLDDYATVYLFFQWLRLQANSSGIYLDIITSTKYNYQAVTDAAKNQIQNIYDNNWGVLLRDWLAANYINSTSGTYGYKDDPVLKNIKAPGIQAGPTTVNLYPGEGVYSRIGTGGFSPSGTGNVKYVSLSGTINATNFNNGETLLTYNIDNNTEGNAIAGVTTGNPPLASVGITPTQGRFAAEPLGPFRVSAGDMQGLYGRERILPNRNSGMAVVR